MTKTRTILLLGRTGSGKSTVANVLLNKNDEFEEIFEESSSSISKTGDFQIGLLEWNLHKKGKEKFNYRIIDTVGVGDNRINPQSVLWKLARVSNQIKEGINQILFVTKGRFTKEEAEAYDLLSSIIFDNEVLKYTSIVKTGFPNFMIEAKCEEDRKKLKEENPIFAHIFKEAKNVIYIDNPPMEGYYLEIAKKVRQDSRKILMNYLENCQEIYLPSNLSTLNQRIEEYMTNEERLEKEMKLLEEKRNQEAEKFLEEIEKINKERSEELKKLEEKNKKEIEEVKEKGKEELKKVVDDMEIKQKEEVDKIRKENSEQVENLIKNHKEESEKTREENKKSLDVIQEQNKKDREVTEKLISELREKNNNSSERISLVLNQLILSKESRSDDYWDLRIKQIEKQENREQEKHNLEMSKLIDQQNQNQKNASDRTAEHIQEIGFIESIAHGASVGGAIGASTGSIPGGIAGAAIGGAVGIGIKLFSEVSKII